MSKNTLNFSLINNLSELDELHTRLSQFGDINGLDQKTVFQMTIVSEEIFTNIISYGYEDAKEHSIGFTLSCKESELVIMIKDDALPFNPLDVETPDLESGFEKRQIGGLGIHFIKNMMDEITYQRRDNKNIVTLRKRINSLPQGNHQT